MLLRTLLNQRLIRPVLLLSHFGPVCDQHHLPP